MDFKLELVLIPVADVDRAKAFYEQQAGFKLDVDHRAGDSFRVVQLTPPGSACSIAFGVGITTAEPGQARGLHLVVADIEAARAELTGRGVEVSEIRHMSDERLEAGRRPGARRLQLVRRLRRPRRQHVGAAGGPARRGGRVTAAAEQTAFAERAERHRRELHVHCYRMLASFDEAEDAVQETMLRAWRSRRTFTGGTLFRAWLYRIATNVCLDTLRRSSRRVTAMTSFAEVPWLQPYPDELLDELAPSDDEPDAVVVERETISLTFLAALQLLPPRQRAALIARDVLGWRADETASILETSVPAANSALQRARATLQEHLPERRTEWASREPSAEERDLLARFIDAHERCDARGGDRDRRAGHPRDDAAVPDVLRRPRRRSRR